MTGVPLVTQTPGTAGTGSRLLSALHGGVPLDPIDVSFVSCVYSPVIIRSMIIYSPNIFKTGTP